MPRRQTTSTEADVGNLEDIALVASDVASSNASDRGQQESGEVARAVIGFTDEAGNAGGGSPTSLVPDATAELLDQSQSAPPASRDDKDGEGVHQETEYQTHLQDSGGCGGNGRNDGLDGSDDTDGGSPMTDLVDISDLVEAAPELSPALLATDSAAPVILPPVPAEASQNLAFEAPEALLDLSLASRTQPPGEARPVAAADMFEPEPEPAPSEAALAASAVSVELDQQTRIRTSITRSLVAASSQGAQEQVQQLHAAVEEALAGAAASCPPELRQQLANIMAGAQVKIAAAAAGVDRKTGSMQAAAAAVVRQAEDDSPWLVGRAVDCRAPLCCTAYRVAACCICCDVFQLHMANNSLSQRQGMATAGQLAQQSAPALQSATAAAEAAATKLSAALGPEVIKARQAMAAVQQRLVAATKNFGDVASADDRRQLVAAAAEEARRQGEAVVAAAEQRVRLAVAQCPQLARAEGFLHNELSEAGDFMEELTPEAEQLFHAAEHEVARTLAVLEDARRVMRELTTDEGVGSILGRLVQDPVGTMTEVHAAICTLLLVLIFLTLWCLLVFEATYCRH